MTTDTQQTERTSSSVSTNPYDSILGDYQRLKYQHEAAQVDAQGGPTGEFQLGRTAEPREQPLTPFPHVLPPPTPPPSSIFITSPVAPLPRLSNSRNDDPDTLDSCLQPPDVDALIKRLTDASEPDVVAVLKQLQIWRYPRADMNSFLPVTKKFGQILANVREKYGFGAAATGECKLQIESFSSEDRTLVLEILRFFRLLMENSTNRKQFDGYEVSCPGVIVN